MKAILFLAGGAFVSLVIGAAHAQEGQNQNRDASPAAQFTPNPDCGCCCTAAPEWVFAGGAELEFLNVYSRFNVALTRQDAARVASSNSGTGDTVPFDFGLEASPLFWVGGVNSCGLGGRVRYWSFDHSTSVQETNTADAFFTPSIGDTTSTHGVVGDTISATTRLNTFMVDGEVTQCLDFVAWNVTLSGGVRGGVIKQDSQWAFTQSGVPGSITSNDNFTLVGPTIAVESQRRLGETHLSLIANARFSNVFGPSSFIEVQNFTGTNTHDTVSGDSAIGMGEMQLGISWSRDLNRGAQLQIDGLWENQLWWNEFGVLPVGNLGLMGFGLAVELRR
jgi:hypothetical protein